MRREPSIPIAPGRPTRGASAPSARRGRGQGARRRGGGQGWRSGTAAGRASRSCSCTGPGGSLFPGGRAMLGVMPDVRIPAIKVILLPKDTNALGTIFGGVILSHIDLASAGSGPKGGPPPHLTKALRGGGVPEPGVLGGRGDFFPPTLAVGRTSLTARACRGGGGPG